MDDIDLNHIKEFSDKEISCVNPESLQKARDDVKELSKVLEESENQSSKEIVTHHSNDELNALLDCYSDGRKSHSDGVLNNQTIAIKDCIAVKNLQMTCGIKNLNYKPSFDAKIVHRLLQSGAEIIGKANMDPFAFGPTGEFSEFGAVKNPTAENYITGGSSSGSAAAVAGELVDIAIGSDTGGSIRVPAACCGLVGVKPTYGTVPIHGFVQMAPSADTVGPITKDVETATTVLSVISNENNERLSEQAIINSLSINKRLEVGLPTDFLDSATEPVSEIMDKVINRLQDDNRISISKFKLNLGNFKLAYPQIISLEFIQMLKQGFVNRTSNQKYEPEWQENLMNPPITQHISDRILGAAYLDYLTDGRSYIYSRNEVIELSRRVEKALNTYDLLLTPTLPRLPPERGEYNSEDMNVHDVLGNTGPFNIAGNPAVSVPWGEFKSRPFGLQVVASKNNDIVALKLAKLIQDKA